MDIKTINYYNINIESISYFYNSNPEKPKYIEKLNLSQNRSEQILDVGFGSGRDYLYLTKEGYNVYGIDGSEKFVEHFLKSNPEYSEKIKYYVLPNKDNPFPIKFDTIICSAVLMHLYDKEISETLNSFSNWLNWRSKLYISIPKRRNDIGEDFRDKNGRYFNPVQPEFISQILSEKSFICKEIYPTGDSLSRDGIEWWNLLYERE